MSILKIMNSNYLSLVKESDLSSQECFRKFLSVILIKIKSDIINLTKSERQEIAVDYINKSGFTVISKSTSTINISHKFDFGFVVYGALYTTVEKEIPKNISFIFAIDEEVYQETLKIHNHISIFFLGPNKLVEIIFTDFLHDLDRDYHNSLSHINYREVISAFMLNNLK